MQAGFVLTIIKGQIIGFMWVIAKFFVLAGGAGFNGVDCCIHASLGFINGCWVPIQHEFL
jgi:hypothetical protein